MSQVHHHQSAALKRKNRVRARIKGSTARPRISFFRSNQHIYLQIINDETGKTLITTSDAKAKAGSGTKTERSRQAAKELVAWLEKNNIKALVIDRGSYKYHGRVKAAVETIREAGVEV